MSKYELIRLDTNTTEYKDGLRYRVKALKDFGSVKKGDIGGFVTNEHNLSQDGNCWIYDDAKIFDSSEIYNNAKMFNNSKMFDNSRMYDDSRMFDDCEMHDNSEMCDNSKMFDNSRMFDNSIMHDNSKMHNNSKMFDNSIMYNNSEMYNNSKMLNNSRMYDNSVMYNNSKMFDKSKMYNDSRMYDYGVLRNYDTSTSFRYKYTASYYFNSKKQLYINMGCHKSIPHKDWINNFRNNTKEFPVNSKAEKDRLKAFNHIMVEVDLPLLILDKVS